MTKTLEVAPETKILIRARELIEQGWIQHRAHSVDMVKRHWWSVAERRDSYCMTGAIEAAYRALGLRGAGNRAFAFVGNVLRAPSIQGWNDRPSRTKAEVLSALDTAISLSMGVPRLP